MAFQSVGFLFILITLAGIVRSDKRINLCEGISGKRVSYTMTLPAENANITFIYGFKNDFSNEHHDTNKTSVDAAVIKLQYDFGTACLFYLLFNETSANWLVKHRGTLLDFTGFLTPNQTRINHNHISKLCNLTKKIYNFTFGISGDQDANAVCNGFLSFDSAFTLVPMLTGEEVPEEHKLTDEEVLDEYNKGKKHKADEVNENDNCDKWTLDVMLCLVFAVIGFVIFMTKYYNNHLFIRYSY